MEIIIIEQFVQPVLQQQYVFWIRTMRLGEYKKIYIRDL